MPSSSIGQGFTKWALSIFAQIHTNIHLHTLLTFVYNLIIQADIGVSNGLISGIGKGGNPDVMEGVDPNLVVGSSTEIIAGEKLIITAGAVDAHVHYICPQQWTEVSFPLTFRPKLPYSFFLRTVYPGFSVWYHHYDRWWDWSLCRHVCNNMHAVAVLHATNACGDG